MKDAQEGSNNQLQVQPGRHALHVPAGQGDLVRAPEKTGQVRYWQDRKVALGRMLFHVLAPRGMARDCRKSPILPISDLSRFSSPEPVQLTTSAAIISQSWPKPANTKTAATKIVLDRRMRLPPWGCMGISVVCTCSMAASNSWWLFGKLATESEPIGEWPRKARPAWEAVWASGADAASLLFEGAEVVARFYPITRSCQLPAGRFF